MAATSPQARILKFQKSYPPPSSEGGASLCREDLRHSSSPLPSCTNNGDYRRRRDTDGPSEYIVEPTIGSLDLALKRIYDVATRSQPTKVAATDPIGEHGGLGQSAEEIEREFEEWVCELIGENGDV